MTGIIMGTSKGEAIHPGLWFVFHVESQDISDSNGKAKTAFRDNVCFPKDSLNRDVQDSK